MPAISACSARTRDIVEAAHTAIVAPAAGQRDYVVILNWNGWRDTVECLESVMRLDGPAPCVVVCDNASSDGSMDRLRQWASGTWRVEAPASPIASDYVPIARDHRVYARDQAERGGAADDPPLVFIETGGNLGFAGGNNVGLRYVLARGDARHVWLLNNDAVADRNALRALVARIEADKAGLCGSTILHYGDPETVQACGGGGFSYLRGTTTGHIGATMKRADLPKHPVDSATIDYVMGASMLVSRAFLERVGLMWEGYFLFFEEIDWAERGRRAGFSITYAPDSFVWHKGGASTGKLVGASYYGSPTDFYFLRNRLLFTRRHRPWLLPLVAGRLALQAVYAAIIAPRRARSRMMMRWQFWFGTGAC